MDSNYNNIPKASHPGRAFLGFFLTFIIALLLITDGYLISLKASVLKGNDVNSLLDNCGFYETMQNAIVDELYKSTDSLGLSRDAINDIFPADTIANAAGTITKAISNNDTIDLSYMKDDCMNVAKSTSNAAVDKVFDEVENSSKVFDAKTLADNPAINKLEKDYGVNITDTVIAEMEKEFGTTSVDLSDADTTQIKKTVSDTLTEKIYPAIDEAFDKYIDNANDIVNKSISAMNDKYNMDDMLRMAENSLRGLIFVIIVITILIIGLFLIELLIYRHSLHRAFRNFSIGALLSGLMIFLSGMFLKFVKDMVFDELFHSFSSTEAIIKDFLESNISSVNNMIIAVGVVYIVVFIIFMAVASAVKKNQTQR